MTATGSHFQYCRVIILLIDEDRKSKQVLMKKYTKSLGKPVWHFFNFKEKLFGTGFRQILRP